MAHLKNTILYSLALLLVVMAPLLGLVAAGTAIWYATLAGSMLYMPLGLIIVLAILAILHSHKKGDLALLALLLTGVSAWFLANAETRAAALEWLSAVADQTALLIGLLVLAVIALGLIYTLRLVAARAMRIRLAQS